MNSCLICQRDFDQDELGRAACRTCQDRLARMLGALPKLYRELGQMLQPSAGARGPRVSGSKNHQLPLNEEALDLRAWGGMVTQLQAHEDDWRRELRMPVAPFRGTVEQTLKRAVDFLTSHLWWAAEKYEGVSDLELDVRRLHNAASSIIDPPEHTIRVGYCPAAYEDGAICGAVLRARPGVASITCSWCHAIYPPESWLTLAERSA